MKISYVWMEYDYFLQIFKIEREGEEATFSPFKDLHNRKLLWHGSRHTNFAGILSQGLRIAPPEAPVVSL
jgi:poly [ADP-ribose] polymerase